MIPVIAFKFNTSVIVTSDLLSITTIQQLDTQLPIFFSFYQLKKFLMK
jgi:hypothetical protein